MKYLRSLPRWQKKTLLGINDIALIYISLWMAFALRLGNPFPIAYIQESWWLFFVFPICTIPFFIAFGLHSEVLQYMGTKVFKETVRGVTFSTIIVGFLMMIIREVSFPRSIIFIYWFIMIVIIIMNRNIAHWALYTLVTGENIKQPVAIYGAGRAGAQIAEIISKSTKYKLIGFIDDNPNKVGTFISSHLVFSSKDIEKLISGKNLKMLLIAIPSLGKLFRRQLLKQLTRYPLSVMELPSLENIIDGKITINDIRPVAVEDILGREPVNPIKNLLITNITGKVVLVTGAGGSIGSELCRQIMILLPQKLILLENSEYSLYMIHKELISGKTDRSIIPILGSVDNEVIVEGVFKKYNVQSVYHAAAYKHVPMVEANACNGVWNNVLGTLNTALMAKKYEAEIFVLISTDKAVRPTNVMGASKRFTELVLQGLAIGDQHTIFTMVRFGNVLDSAGSVVPLFREQIKNNGPITVTHPDITRYFMSIPEAVQLVIQAGAMATGGEVFVLDMGDPIKIVDLARSMIYLSGLIPKDDNNPNGDISIEFIGLRPGEKLYEELLVGANDEGTIHPRIMCAHETSLDWEMIQQGINEIKLVCKSNDNHQIRTVLKKYIGEYQSSN